MTPPYRLVFICSIVSALGLGFILPDWQSANAAVESCPTPPALSRFRRHIVARGETLESIAQLYNLNPATISSMNPAVKNGKVSVGSELQIAPYNGIVVEVPQGQTWRQIAAKYKVRADAMFEINGCQEDPRVVFVPGINGLSNRPVAAPPTRNIPPSQISGYPLPALTNVVLPYSWQIHPTTGEVFFHSGVDLLAAVGTPVQAIAPGIVAFANEQGSYGNLVIINHSGGLQSRYAHLETINVSIGQQVNKGDLLGTVGTTGQPAAKQPHLHFEVRSSSSLGWAAQDPKSYLQK